VVPLQVIRRFSFAQLLARLSDPVEVRLWVHLEDVLLPLSVFNVNFVHLLEQGLTLRVRLQVLMYGKNTKWNFRADIVVWARFC